MKEFQAQDFDCIKKIIGKSVSNIFYQPVADILAYVDMFVVNFGEKAEMSLHIFSSFRVADQNTVLLTCSDCYFGNDFERLTEEQIEESRDNCFKGTLLNTNINKLVKLLKNAKVIDAYATNIGDIIIKFDNLITMDIRIDALCNQECYRLIIYTGDESQHNSVTCNYGRLYFDSN